MPNIKMEDLIEKEVDSTSETTEQAVEETTTEEVVETTEQDPLKVELDRVRTRGTKSEKEKAEFSLRKNAERLKELGGDPASILGIEKEDIELEDEDDAPVTVGMLKKIQQQSAAKTALDLANEIQNETERELVIFHLQNSIRSTGNPNEDLKLATSIVNGVKNTQITEEITRKTEAKTHSNSSSAPAIEVKTEGELTPTEQAFMKPPFNLSREQIIKARG